MFNNNNNKKHVKCHFMWIKLQKQTSDKRYVGLRSTKVGRNIKLDGMLI